jgi:farnesol dehydrogenase
MRYPVLEKRGIIRGTSLLGEIYSRTFSKEFHPSIDIIGLKNIPKAKMGRLPKVFVTGGTGFIGTKLVNELARRGHTVHVLRRPMSNVDGLEREGVRLYMGELRDPDSIRKGMEGCQQVYHLAAYAKNWAKDQTVFYRSNVDGFCNVWEWARRLGVERMVYVSTILTCGPSTPGTVEDERRYFPVAECCTHYQRSKTIGEKQACDSAEQGFPMVIVNPTRVYGPGKLTEGNSVSRMIDLYDRGKFPLLLNQGGNIGNYTFVDDVVQGLTLAMERGRIGERYILGGENVSLKQLFKLIDEIGEKRHVQINVPPWAALLFSHWEEKKARWVGNYPLITVGWVKTFLQDWRFSSAKAEKELGYRITPLREGIRITLEWLRHIRKETT